MDIMYYAMLYVSAGFILVGAMLYERSVSRGSKGKDLSMFISLVFIIGGVVTLGFAGEAIFSSGIVEGANQVLGK